MTQFLLSCLGSRLVYLVVLKHAVVYIYKYKLLLNVMVSDRAAVKWNYL